MQRRSDHIFKEVEASRVEERYFGMVADLWEEGRRREEETGEEVGWYVFT